MAKKKLLEDIKVRPARFYRVPTDVARDRRFAQDERLEILEAWAAAAAAEEPLSSQIRQVIADMKGRVAGNHAAE